MVIDLNETYRMMMTMMIMIMIMMKIQNDCNSANFEAAINRFCTAVDIQYDDDKVDNENYDANEDEHNQKTIIPTI
jgi:hypothetical protein